MRSKYVCLASEEKGDKHYGGHISLLLNGTKKTINRIFPLSSFHTLA
jgi:hypothetical protein